MKVQYDVMKKKPVAKVFLVGAGPGDPGLITVKGLQILREADVVVFDALAPAELLNEVKVGCELINVGKHPGDRPTRQKNIIQLLIKKAKLGKQVVRLKGGDPFVFGRGGEEGEALAKARIRFEVVPGVTAGIAVPAYAGIPLTHRDYNSAVTMLTGHAERELDWKSLATQECLVMFMAVKNLGKNMKNLISHGKDPQSLVAAIESGTRAEQRVVTGTIRTIAEVVKKKTIKAPAIVIVGKQVALREKLNWFETKPLFGKKILVTRASHQASELSERLQMAGADSIEIPTVEIAEPRSFAGLDQAISHLQGFDWLLLTSANGVRAFFERLQKKRVDSRALGGIKLGVIGPVTARVLEEYGVCADYVAKTYQAEGFLKALPQKQFKGKKVLIARAAEARDVLPDSLKKWGASVNTVAVYRSVIPKESRRRLKKLMKSDPPDLLTFASSSMVDNFVTMLSVGPAGRSPLQKARKIPCACIGPITAKSARKHRMNVVIQPKKFTIPDLVDAMERYYS
jgi:uroporphyrinogen III methyltransferase / synthase